MDNTIPQDTPQRKIKKMRIFDPTKSDRILDRMNNGENMGASYMKVIM